MKRLAILGVAIGLLAFAAMPAEASCGSLRQINSLATPGGNSYVAGDTRWKQLRIHLRFPLWG